MNISPKVQRIMNWRQYLSLLPDELFFEFMRMYLGEIKTPYNKQKLIENLSAFLRKEENRKAIVHLLSGNDLKILTVITTIPKATEKTVTDFFSSEYDFRSIYEHIKNLEERLILFRHKESEQREAVLLINPMLEDDIIPNLSTSLLLKPPECAEKEEKTGFALSPLFLASFISFAQIHPDLCKANGELKKKSLSDAEAIYGGQESEMPKRLELLAKSFINLQLLKETKKGYTVDWARLKLFAEQRTSLQYLYLAAASCGAFTRLGIQENAQLLTDTLLLIPENGYTRHSILQLGQLQKQISLPDDFPRRFGSLLSRSRYTEPDNKLETMVTFCITLGILKRIGKTARGEDIFVLPADFFGEEKSAEEEKKVLSIDAGFIITILPGLSLSELLPLVQCMTIQHFDVIASFEINRAAALKAFDCGITLDELLSHLKTYSSYEIPQNLCVCIEEWYASYTSATLYKGYIMRVAEDNPTLSAKNPRFSAHIKEELAHGVFLMDFSSDEEAFSVLQRSGLDFVGSIKGVEEKGLPLGLPTLSFVKKNAFAEKRAVETPEGSAPETSAFLSPQEQNDFLQHLHEKLTTMQLTDEQKDVLKERINRRIIVNENQLQANSVRFELLEAAGMDYAGKMHVLEKAMQTKSLVEIELEASQKVLTGLPIFLSKKAGKAEVTIKLEGTGTEKTLLISAASHVKKIRTAISYED